MTRAQESLAAAAYALFALEQPLDLLGTCRCSAGLAVPARGHPDAGLVRGRGVR